MIAPLKQPPHIDADSPRRLEAAAAAADVFSFRSQRGAWLAAALGFFCLMPYAAITVGNRSSMQVGNVLTLLMAMPALLASWRQRTMWVFPLLIAPLVVGTFKVALANDGDLSLSIKTTLVLAMACLTIVATQLYAPSFFLSLLTGLAVATLVHFVVGVVQWVAFSRGEFPLLWMYQNESFLSVQENADTIAKYTQRPFGIFPEPSAMSSSLAPWVLFWIAHLCGIIRLRRQPARWQNVLFGAAAVAGLALIILSRSGHSAITMAAVLVFGVIWFVRCRATPQTFAVLVGVFGVALPVVLYFAAMQLADRLGGGASNMGNSSWEERSDSLRIGFQLLVDGTLATLVFGIGPGLTSPILQHVYRLEAVWSVSLTYIYETGLVGVAAVGWVGAYLLRTWKSLRFDVAFVAITLVWLVGITITTSYYELLSLWLTLGWLTVWPQICEPAAARTSWQPGFAVFRQPAPAKRRRPRLALSRPTLPAPSDKQLPRRPWTEN